MREMPFLPMHLIRNQFTTPSFAQRPFTAVRNNIICFKNNTFNYFDRPNSEHLKGKRVFGSLVPRRSLLHRFPREVWERAGERRPSQYWQNTPDFRAILPPGHFLRVSTAPFSKNCSPIVWMCRLKCLQTAVSSNFVAYYVFWLIFCSSWWIVYGQRFS